MERSACARRRWLAAVVAAASLIGPIGRPVLAETEDPDEGIVHEGLFGASSALASFAYGPVKIAYALGGLTLGGLSYLWTWGDKDISGTVIRTALAGDYVVTPEHLGGAKDIEFAGD